MFVSFFLYSLVVHLLGHLHAQTYVQSQAVVTTTTTIMSPPTLLTIPLEIRLQIYAHLLTLSPLPIYADCLPSSRPLIHPAILLVCHQTHHEATPILYRSNTFSLRQDRIAASERPPKTFDTLPQQVPTPLVHLLLRPRMKATPREVARKHGVRRFLLQWRKDAPTARAGKTDKVLWGDVREVLTGAESVTLQLLVGDVLQGSRARRLESLEGVRGVKKFEAIGATKGMEDYLEWLRGAMGRPVRSEVEPFMKTFP